MERKGGFKVGDAAFLDVTEFDLEDWASTKGEVFINAWSGGDTGRISDPSVVTLDRCDEMYDDDMCALGRSRLVVHIPDPMCAFFPLLPLRSYGFTNRDDAFANRESDRVEEATVG
jgi:hypothetical protein